MTDNQQPIRRENHLRAWREFRGLTQAQLAAAVGTEGSVISLLESGDRGLSDRWLRRLAPALATTPVLLLGFTPDQVKDAVQDVWRVLPDWPSQTTGGQARLRSFGASRTDAAVPDPRVDPGYDIPELWWQIPDEDKPAALAALKARIPRH